MAIENDEKGISAHQEVDMPATSKWLGSSKDGDVALALFADSHDMNEPIDPAVEKKLRRKIDWLILPLYV